MLNLQQKLVARAAAEQGLPLTAAAAAFIANEARSYGNGGIAASVPAARLAGRMVAAGERTMYGKRIAVTTFKMGV